MSGAGGEFAFESLDPELYFQLLVYQPGFVPTYTEGYYDPLAGPLTVTLAAHDLAEREPELVLRGRVVDPHGDPVARAVITPLGRTLPRGKQYGGLDGVDELALTDEHGEFALGVSAPGEELLVQVTARGFATRFAPWMKAGPEVHTVSLGRGVTVTGRVQKDGKPLTGVELGLAQVDRDAEHFLGERTIGTGPDGRFTFVNVVPEDAWTLYGLMSTFKAHGALSTRPVRTGAHETTLDVGTLEVGPGARLTGRVELEGGAALPPDFRLLLGREEAWDTQVALVGADGRFAFEGLPKELYTLSTRFKGYRISPRNESYDFVNHQGLIGRVEADTELVLLLEPGAEERELRVRADPGLWERYEALLAAPLRGWPGSAPAPAPR